MKDEAFFFRIAIKNIAWWNRSLQEQFVIKETVHIDRGSEIRINKGRKEYLSQSAAKFKLSSGRFTQFLSTSSMRGRRYLRRTIPNVQRLHRKGQSDLISADLLLGHRSVRSDGRITALAATRPIEFRDLVSPREAIVSEKKRWLFYSPILARTWLLTSSISGVQISISPRSVLQHLEAPIVSCTSIRYIGYWKRIVQLEW